MVAITNMPQLLLKGIIEFYPSKHTTETTNRISRMVLSATCRLTLQSFSIEGIPHLKEQKTEMNGIIWPFTKFETDF